MGSALSARAFCAAGSETPVSDNRCIDQELKLAHATRLDIPGPIGVKMACDELQNICCRAYVLFVMMAS